MFEIFCINQHLPYAMSTGAERLSGTAQTQSVRCCESKLTTLSLPPPSSVFSVIMCTCKVKANAHLNTENLGAVSTTIIVLSFCQVVMKTVK